MSTGGFGHYGDLGHLSPLCPRDLVYKDVSGRFRHLQKEKKGTTVVPSLTFQITPMIAASGTSV